MNEVVISVRMSDPLLSEATFYARQAGVSLDDWLLAVASEQILHARAFKQFFSRTPDRSDSQVMMEILNSTTDNPPDPGDELPEGFIPPWTT